MNLVSGSQNYTFALKPSTKPYVAFCAIGMPSYSHYQEIDCRYRTVRYMRYLE